MERRAISPELPGLEGLAVLASFPESHRIALLESVDLPEDDRRKVMQVLGVLGSPEIPDSLSSELLRLYPEFRRSQPKRRVQLEFDLFLSYATPDKEWVLTLAERLEARGLRVFVDSREIAVGDNFVLRLSDGLEKSRYMVLVLSSHTGDRPWVAQEWTSFVAGHGPLGRLLPVKIDAVELPALLKATQAMDATDRDATRAADELFKVVGDPSTLPADDARRLVLGRDLVFTLSRDDEQLSVVRPDGSSRTVPLPWKADASFGVAHLEFGKLHREPLTKAGDRADLFRHARVLGSALFETLFDPQDAKRFAKLLTTDRARPVVQVRSDEDLLLSLPWELLHYGDEFLVREGRIDLVRTTPTEVVGEALLREPTTPFKLVVNVSAPEDSHLGYEAESYRITLATAERCAMVPTELGTLEDLVATVDAQEPTGIHFSGHGMPGALLFEDQEGRNHAVEVSDVIQSLRQRLPDERRLPPFFYLASCHGNDPPAPGEDQAGASSAAVQLHKAGVTEVVGYFGPIVDELSTRAEETIYEAIAKGHSTRHAVRLARERLTHPFHQRDARHRPRPMRSDTADAVAAEDEAANREAEDVATDTHPFAWAQLVFYRRGSESPLSIPVPAGKRQAARVLQRHFEGFGDRKILKAGFIGRRLEQHKIRRRIREGNRVLVLQGLGGLGKSTLAQRVLPWLTDDEANVCTLWCQEVEGQENRAEALVGQLLEYCRKRFGLDWEGVVQQVDQVAGDDAAKRFVYFLQTLAQSAPGLVLYLDNLESLLIGPEDEADSSAFGQWAEPALEAIWRNADQMARDTKALYVIASCRYRNDAFASALLPVTPLPADALFRLTEWFPALQRLATLTRARLVSRLDGHPRAVEYANDLVEDAFTKWRDTQGEWALSVPPKPEEVEQEWLELVNPCLPQVAEKLKDNLLLQALWDRVLDEPARRFLYRMTVLRQPAEWDLLGFLGEADEPAKRALETAQRLRDTSLLEQVELRVRVSKDQLGTSTRYTLHPATVRFIREAHGDLPELRIQAHHRLGEHLEATAKESPYIDTDIEAGHHLFEAGEYDRAYKLLGSASSWLQNHGRVREGLRVLEPFLETSVRTKLDRTLLNRLFGTVGISHLRFGEVQKAIGYLEQALVISREIGDRQGEGDDLGNLGIAYANLGEVQKAIGYHEQALVISREIGDRRGEGSDLGSLGNAYVRLGEVQKAIGYHEQALVIVREIGDR
ncbi:MAG: TIR domain-containing protein, partial [Myxococcales bacterium]|nr:TIR domain-containing protein [Myxococcales bacterium]